MEKGEPGCEATYCRLGIAEVALTDSVLWYVNLLQSHAGKVVLRSWYERNKHIFPASRWEPYDPEKKWDKYTVSLTKRYH